MIGAVGICVVDVDDDNAWVDGGCRIGSNNEVLDAVFEVDGWIAAPGV